VFKRLFGRRAIFSLLPAQRQAKLFRFVVSDVVKRKENVDDSHVSLTWLNINVGNVIGVCVIL